MRKWPRPTCDVYSSRDAHNLCIAQSLAPCNTHTHSRRRTLHNIHTRKEFFSTAKRDLLLSAEPEDAPRRTRTARRTAANGISGRSLCPRSRNICMALTSSPSSPRCRRRLQTCASLRRHPCPRPSSWAWPCPFAVAVLLQGAELRVRIAGIAADLGEHVVTVEEVGVERAGRDLLHVEDRVARRRELHVVAEDRLDLGLGTVDLHEAERVAWQDVGVVHLALQVEHHRLPQFRHASRVGAASVGRRGGAGGGAAAAQLAHVQLADAAEVARQVEEVSGASTRSTSRRTFGASWSGNRADGGARRLTFAFGRLQWLPPCCRRRSATASSHPLQHPCSLMLLAVVLGARR